MLLGTIFLLGLATIVNAQDNQAAPDPPDQGQQSAQQQDPPQDQQPAPGVARMSFIRGNVSTQSGGSGDWNAAGVNTPVSVGDRVSTGNGSRAEVQLDYANVLRLDQNASATIANITRSQLQVQIGQGLATFSVLRGGEAITEIDTPNVSIHPLKEGQYRVDVATPAVTRVTVRKGQADISTPQGSTRVESGQTITIQGTTAPQYQVSDGIGRDDWDKWNSDRDGMIVSAKSWQHTDPYYVGSQDLDGYGQWTNDPAYGSVWVPTQTAGWAPYSVGRWSWTPYYGWTWVSGEPWGWAPYHYGRWYVYNSAWAWWPGPVYGYPGYRYAGYYGYPGYYPAWAPAYVSFFGFGGGFGWGFGFGFGWGGGWGRWGWLPCGPGGWYHPWYGGWGRGGVHITNINNVNNYNNAAHGVAPLSAHGADNEKLAATNSRVRSGVSTMSGKDFGNAAVPAQSHSMSASEFKQGSAMAGKLPAVPSKSSLASTNHAASPSTIRGGTPSSQHFAGKAAPAPRSFNNEVAQAQKAANESRTAASNENGKGASASHNESSAKAGSEQGGRTSPSASNSGASKSPTQTQSASSTRSAQPTTQTHANTPNATQTRSNAPNATQTRNGWQSFQPRSATPTQGQSAQRTANAGQSASQRGAMNSSTHANTAASSPSHSGWQSFSPRTSTPSSANSGYSRPALNMHQPVVTQRSASSYNNGSNRGSYNGGYNSGSSANGGNHGGYPAAGASGSRAPSGGSSSHSSGGHASSGGHGGGGHGGGGGHR